MRVVAEPPTAPQATVPLNMQTLSCVSPFISTHQPTIDTKDDWSTDLIPNPRGGTAKAHWHRQERPSGTTPLSSVLEVTGLTVHSIPVGGGQGFAYVYVWEPVCLMPMEAEDTITLELELQTDVSPCMGLCKSSKYSEPPSHLCIPPHHHHELLLWEFPIIEDMIIFFPSSISNNPPFPVHSNFM